MKISITQTRAIKGDIAANIETHKKFIEEAYSLKADAIFFPELSLTGYEPTLAKELATHPYDSRLDVFQKISDTKKMTIGLGIPISSETGIRISMLIFQPNSTRQLYSKQQLHSDELPYFVNGNEQIIITVNNIKIAPAICYESLQPNHAESASKLGAKLYLTSVAKSENGFIKGLKYYPEVAKKYNIPVLMSNSVGFCDNFLCIGKSSVWSKNGVLIGQLDKSSEGLLVYDTNSEELIKKVS